MPTARGSFGIAVVGGKIYAIGGLNQDSSPLSVTEEYNPQKNEWITKAPMPTARSGFAVAVFENKIYAIGGAVGIGFVSNNEVYDPVTNTWQTKASMPTPRADLSANIVGDKIYLISGKKYSSKTPFFQEVNMNEVYDPATDTWSTKKDIPTGVQGYASAVIGTKIYVMGGSRQPSSVGLSVIVNNNQVYDSQTDNWTLAAGLPKTGSYGAAVVTEGFMAPQKIYYIGGFSEGQFSGRTDIYDPKNNSWSVGDSMLTPRSYLGLAVIDDVLFAIGGFDGTKWLGTTEEFKPIGYGKVSPTIEIISPENKTYSEVLLHFTINKVVEWTGYSIDEMANVSLNSQIKLTNLTQGTHSVKIFANDSRGNMGSSKTVVFSIDIQPPKIEIILPQNISYGTRDVQLTFTSDENLTSIYYSLDNQTKVPIVGNVTLVALPNGSHEITVFASDDWENSSQESINFEIAPIPTMTIVASIAIIIIVLSSGFIIIKHKKSPKEKKDLSSNSNEKL